MQKETDWFKLLFEHIHRQANFATVQILVSVFFLGLAWRQETPCVAVVVMLVVYPFCAGYLIYSLHQIQDRRITLWKYIAFNELGRIPDGNKLSQNSDNQDANDKEPNEKKLREDYIIKLRPASKWWVLTAHIIVSSFALIIILLAAVLKKP